MNIKDLSKILGVTEKTVRLDLDKLAKMQVLQRVHGGAVLEDKIPTAVPTSAYRSRFMSQKRCIARQALTYLQENDVILLDDGSTTLELAKLLGDFRLTVLTNDILIVSELMYKPNISLYVIGGPMKRDGESFVINGEDAIHFVKKYRVNKLFLGISTIDIANGLMIYYYGDRDTKRAFMAAADEVICLADSSKFNKSAFTRIAQIEEVHTIITDPGISEEDFNRYSDLGIKIIRSEYCD